MKKEKKKEKERNPFHFLSTKLANGRLGVGRREPRPGGDGRVCVDTISIGLVNEGGL